MPTPSDIVQLIKRGNKPPLCKEIYIALSRKEDYQRSNAEDAYMREYEAEFSGIEPEGKKHRTGYVGM